MKRLEASYYSWPQATQFSASVVALMFFLELVDHLTPWQLDGLGIIPRTPRGLIGIVFSPLLHVHAGHLLANAIPLFVLLVLLFHDRAYKPERAFLLIWVASGAGTWLIGRGGTPSQPVVHIGASGLIFGLVAYLMAAGLYMRSWKAAFIALVVFILYGGIFADAFPQRGRFWVSWEGHLAGAIAGWWAARKNHVRRHRR